MLKIRRGDLDLKVLEPKNWKISIDIFVSLLVFISFIFYIPKVAF